MKINEVAKLTGVTVRTLHYYDEIGLLKPSEITDAGYRLYDAGALELLQQILFFRELDFPLNDIRDIMTNPRYDKTEALRKQRELLIQKRNRLDNLIGLVGRTLEGDINMNFEAFDMTEIENTRKKYAAEARERWGNTDAYKECERKTAGYDERQWEMINGEGAAIIRSFAESRHLAPGSGAAQALVQKWQDYISANFYKCPKEILSCLGLMYMSDDRFKENIDRSGKGTAEFMAEAIAVYCAK